MRKGRVPFIVTFLVPPLALYVVFVLSPFVQGIQLSFTDWTGLSPDFSYVGFDNYARLMADEQWWNAALNNLKLLVVVPVATLALALVFATLVTRGGAGGVRRSLPGAGVYRVIYFFPQVIPVVVSAILFQFIYTPGNGLLAQLLDWVGIDMNELIPGGPIGNHDVILWAIAWVVIWASVGFYLVLFMAGMQQIPRDLYEAAAIDGAGRTRMFFSVTFPLLWGHIQVALVYIGIQTLDMFALVSVMARNGQTSNYGADVMSTRLYSTAFTENSQFGYGSAMGTMLLLFSILFAIVTFRVTRRDQVEY